MTMHNGAYFEAVNGLCKARAPEKGINFERFTLYRVDNRGIVKNHDSPPAVHRAHDVFQPHRFIHRFCNKCLDRRFTERAQHSWTKSAGKALHTDKGYAVNFSGLAIEQVHTRVTKDSFHLVGMSRLVIVVAKDADYRDRADTQLFSEDFRLCRSSGISEVTAKDQGAGALGDCLKQFTERAGLPILHMKIADACKCE
jgi:hypothetical protein